MLHRRKVLALVLFAAGLGACSQRPPRAVFDEVGAIDGEGAIAVLRARTEKVRSLYGEISIGYESPDFEGSFDAVVYYERPGSVRLSAFKDVIIAVEFIFDLIATPDAHALAYADEESSEVTVFRATEPGDEFPRFAGFHWAREAFCLAGALSDAPASAERQGDVFEVRGTLSSGASIQWTADARTLAVQRGVVTTPGGQILTLEYSDYRAQAGVFVPGRVVFTDRDTSSIVDARLDFVEIDPVVDGWVFDPATVGS